MTPALSNLIFEGAFYVGDGSTLPAFQAVIFIVNVVLTKRCSKDEAAALLKTKLTACAPPLILDVPNGVSDSLYTFGNIIGNDNVVFLLKFHDHFDGFERICAQIRESGISINCVGRGAQNIGVALSYGMNELG